MNPCGHIGTNPWTGNRPNIRYHNTEKRGHTPMPEVRLEPTISDPIPYAS